MAVAWLPRAVPSLAERVVPHLPRRLVAVWRRLSASLRARILIPTVLLFGGTLPLMIAGTLELHSADMEGGLRERAEIFGDMLADGYAAMQRQEGGAARTAELLRVAAGHRKDIDSICLVAPSGEVLFSSPATLEGSHPWPDLPRYDKPTFIGSPGGNPRQFALIRPVYSVIDCPGGGCPPVGFLDIRFSREPVLTAGDRLAQTLAVTAVPALLALVAIAWWLLGREAIRPLHRLVSAMERAGAGDLTVRADEGRPDELGVVARSFDDMLAALREARARLESLYHDHMVRADRFAVVGQLAANLAHEIKNPLAGLSGALELLADDLGASDPRAEMTAEMQHQVTRLTQTMNGLLSFARPPSVQLRSTDVHGTLERALFLVRQQRRKGGEAIEIERHLAPDLPRAFADPSQLEQVFLNLCLNAFQAMHPRGGTLTARTSAEGGHIVVELSDTGPGIDAEVRPHIFEPFFTTKHDGTGLGLVISARVLAEHGGTIECTSVEGTGAVFTVRLPVEAAGASS